MFHRWKGATTPAHHVNEFNGEFQSSKRMKINSEVRPDVYLSLPADSTVRVQSGNQIEVPLTIIPNDSIIVAGFEFTRITR